jgi:hypothetical protein
MMKYKPVKKIFFIFILSLLLFLVFVFVTEPIFFPEANTQVYEDCRLIQIGMTYDEVVKIMGKPDSETRKDKSVKLLYLVGGVQTEAGIGFEFQNENLINKNCGVD